MVTEKPKRMEYTLTPSAVSIIDQLALVYGISKGEAIARAVETYARAHNIASTLNTNVELLFSMISY